MSKYDNISDAINKVNETIKDKPNFNITSITFCLLGVAFVILKLCGVINWSWIWVLAPFWIPFSITILILILLIIFLAIVIACSKK